MREVIGRQGLAANFELYGTVGGVCRWCPRRLRQSKRSHYTPFRCTVYRADPQDVPDTKQEVGQARSRLLDRNSLSQPQKQQRGGRLIRRTEPPPEPEASRGSQQPSSRLLQRSPSLKNTTKGLTRSTDTLRRSKDGNTKAGSVKQLNDRAKQQNASTNTRFSQEAGKLSQKDWQVTTDWLTLGMQEGLLDERIWKELVADCGLDPWERPQATLFHQLGMTKADFTKLVTSRRSNGLLQLRVPTIRNKLHFFRDKLGLSNDEVRKMLVKCPRIMEHKLESTMKPHLEFLELHGVKKEDLGKVVQSAPQTFQLSIEETLQPRTAFLTDRLGISPEGLAKILVRQPSVLTYSIQFMQQRIDFLIANGMPVENVAKAVVSHPQVLHYSVDSMKQKLQYLREIGMERQQVAQSISRLPQLLALDVRHNMKPKYNYLQSEMGGTVQTLCSYPAYFSLSLLQRIIPRHRFLQMVRAEPMNPFPMGYLKMSDVKFASSIANTPLPRFESFRAELLSGRRFNS